MLDTFNSDFEIRRRFEWFDIVHVERVVPKHIHGSDGLIFPFYL